MHRQNNIYFKDYKINYFKKTLKKKIEKYTFGFQLKILYFFYTNYLFYLLICLIK